jgi:hypothetical protein
MRMLKDVAISGDRNVINKGAVNILNFKIKQYVTNWTHLKII